MGSGLANGDSPGTEFVLAREYTAWKVGVDTINQGGQNRSSIQRFRQVTDTAILESGRMT